MNYLIKFNPAITTANLGDIIISNAIDKEMEFFFCNYFVVNITTRYPFDENINELILNAPFKFVMGTNILRNDISDSWPCSHPIHDIILVGVSWKNETKKRIKPKTIQFLKESLSKTYFHSVRDSYTENLLKSLGFSNVINTGCPTIWGLSKRFCERIKKNKSNNCVFTITDYNKNSAADKKFIDFLIHNYRKVFFWPQGLGDISYFCSLNLSKKIVVLRPNINSLKDVLIKEDADYVGTRLHAGIFALNLGKRAFILSVDKRMQIMKEDFCLPIIDREDIDILSKSIESSFCPNIKIPSNNIKKWKDQFYAK